LYNLISYIIVEVQEKLSNPKTLTAAGILRVGGQKDRLRDRQRDRKIKRKKEPSTIK
jgi:hypothetical protein